MATIIEGGAGRRGSLAPDAFERILAIGAMLLLAAVAAAVVRGHAQWGSVPGIVWAHIVTILVALALTPRLMLGCRGDRRHRWLGRIWVAAMLLTAALSFGIHLGNPGGFSVIHILSAWVLIQAPLLWYTARTHQIARHRRHVRGLVTGALLVAGAFTFPFNRLLGHWLFG